MGHWTSVAPTPLLQPVTSLPVGFWASAVGHLVEGGERCEHAALVRLHDVSVLDHLVQDDVDSVQVEHDLMTTSSQRNTHTHTNTPDVYVSDRKCWLIVMVTDSRWERIHPVHSVETNRDTVIRLEDEQDNKRDAATIRCIQTHHPAEVFIQNLHEVMNQLVDGQLVLRRQTLSEYFHFMPHLICKPKSHWQWTTSSVQNPREEKRYNYKKSILNHFLCKNVSHFYFLIMRQEPKTKRFSIVWLLMKKRLQEIKEKHPKIQWCDDSSSCNNRCRLRLLDISELSAACTSQIQLYV